jgi:hypothetical protein
MSSAMSAFEIETGQIDWRGEWGFADPPQQPFGEFPPLKPQRRPQARLKKPFALLRVEPRPALHRALEQIIAPHLATFRKRGAANRDDVSGNKSNRSRR